LLAWSDRNDAMNGNVNVNHRGPPLLRFGFESIESVFDREAILAVVKQALVDQARSHFIQAPPMHLSFAGGDCHIKAGYPRDGATFAIKIATGFYANDRIGLDNGNGLLLLASQETGEPLVLFEDRGFLTAWRTVAATILAAEAGNLSDPIRAGIVGAGLQAQLAAEWVRASGLAGNMRLWGRNVEKTRAVVERLHGVELEVSLETLCRECNLIITTTPSATPLIRADWIRPGTHVVALGADNPGKLEIEPALFARCDSIMTDDHLQCLDHGDFGAAVRAGVVSDTADVSLGEVLSGRAIVHRRASSITIADLTGLAAQDHAIATLFHRRLMGSLPPP
jgi:ornithine cyclodeaminase